jgi:hypothetical protein
MQAYCQPCGLIRASLSISLLLLSGTHCMLALLHSPQAGAGYWHVLGPSGRPDGATASAAGSSTTANGLPRAIGLGRLQDQASRNGPQQHAGSSQRQWGASISSGGAAGAVLAQRATGRAARARRRRLDSGSGAAGVAAAPTGDPNSDEQVPAAGGVGGGHISAPDAAAPADHQRASGRSSSNYMAQSVAAGMPIGTPWGWGTAAAMQAALRTSGWTQVGAGRLKHGQGCKELHVHLLQPLHGRYSTSIP